MQQSNGNWAGNTHNYLNTRMRMVLKWSKSFSTLGNWIMNIPMMYFCDFCVDCKIADRMYRGEDDDTRFYQRISDTLTVLAEGGGTHA